MKLLIVSDYSWPAGGAEQFVKELLERARESWECRLLTWDGDLLLPSGFDRLLSPQMGDVRPLWSAFDWADCLMVVTSFNVRLLAHTAGEYLKGSSKPAITVIQTSAHSDPDSPSREAQGSWLRDLVAASRTTVAVSEAVAASLRDLGADPGANLTVIENGTRFAGPYRSAPRNRRRVSFIGRPVPQKGFHHFQRLARELSWTDLEFFANTVSLPPPEEVAGIRSCHGLDDAELLSFFERSDLLLAPYLWADGLPLALLEALSCGVPTLGFDLPPVGPLLRRHGQAVIPPNYESLLEAVSAWRAGDLRIDPPTGVGVPSWTEQWARYEQLLLSVTWQGPHQRVT